MLFVTKGLKELYLQGVETKRTFINIRGEPVVFNLHPAYPDRPERVAVPIRVALGTARPLNRVVDRGGGGVTLRRGRLGVVAPRGVPSLRHGVQGVEHRQVEMGGRRLSRFETNTRHPDDQPIDTGEATIGIFGMGRIGTMAYDFMREKYGDQVMGFDFNAEKVRMHCEAGRQVVFGDPTDPDFWPRIKRQKGNARLALLTMPKHQTNLASTRHLVEIGFSGTIAAIAHFDDQVEELIFIA